MRTVRRHFQVGILLLVSSSLFSQVPMEPRARLQARIDKEASSWFEGFSGVVRGSEAAYESHRSKGRRDPAFVVRTNDAGKSIEWRTHEIDVLAKREAFRFLWTCGFGSNQGNEPLVLLVNGKERFSFTTRNDSEWTVAGQEGGALTFTLMGRTQYGASLGYMSLEAPSAWCSPGKPLILQIKPATSNVDIWYRLYSYDNSLRHFLSMERRSVYTSWSCPNFGDATLTIVSQSSLTGKVATVRTPRGVLGTSSLRPQGNIARTELTVPHAQQGLLEPPILIQIESETPDTVETPNFEEQRIKAFMEEEIVFDKYIFPVGEFPPAAWKNPGLVTNLIGTATLKVDFFNGSYEHVQKAGKPGRFGAMISCRTASGFSVERFATLYCIPTSYETWIQGLQNSENNNESPSVRKQWNDFQRSEIKRFLSEKSTSNLTHDPEASIFFAGLSDMENGSRGNDSPRIRDRQWWIDFKNRSLGSSQKVIQLRLPVTERQERGTILKESDPSKMGYRSEDLEDIRKICASWAEQTGEPNVTLIACNGEVIFHEAFGKNADGTSASKTTPMWMASITKLLTGSLMMQFVDQGLVDLDAPVAKYLAELPKHGPPVLTVRDLFTHTNGFGWHGEWASDWNMSLENYLAQCLPICHVREKHQYNRMGYAVAGKIMERLTGRSVPALFNDYLLTPLGMSRTFVDNTYGSCQATAFDIALVGQMLLNKGRAAAVRVFSEKTFERMLPESIMGPRGRLEREWGIGTSWLGGDGFSKKTFGHEAASGALLRIDPELQMVLVSARNRTGDNYSVYESFKSRLLSAATKSVKNSQSAR